MFCLPVPKGNNAHEDVLLSTFVIEDQRPSGIALASIPASFGKSGAQENLGDWLKVCLVAV